MFVAVGVTGCTCSECGDVRGSGVALGSLSQLAAFHFYNRNKRVIGHTGSGGQDHLGVMGVGKLQQIAQELLSTWVSACR